MTSKYNIVSVYTENNILYSLYDNFEAQVIGCDLEEEIDLVLPSTIQFEEQTYTVTDIRNFAFENDRFIHKITLPATIEHIGSYAFTKTTIKEVIFENDIHRKSISIDEAAFSNNVQLERVSLPEGLYEIENECFKNCVSLKSINTPNTLTSIGNKAFFGCEELHHFDFKEKIVAIGTDAFSYTSISYVEIGKRTEVIGENAFSNIETLKTVVICGNTSKINKNFLNNDQRIIFYIKGDSSDLDIIDFTSSLSKNYWIIVDDFKLEEIEGLKYLLFSKKVARIVGYNESDLDTYVVAPNKIEDYDVVDFQPGFMKYSNKVVEFVFPSSIKRIKGKVFEGCTKLKKVVFTHTINTEDANWVLSNKYAKLAIIDPSDLQQFDVIIESIFSESYSKIKLQRSFTKRFVGLGESDVLNKVNEWCEYNGSESNHYSIINVFPVN